MAKGSRPSTSRRIVMAKRPAAARHQSPGDRRGSALQTSGYHVKRTAPSLNARPATMKQHQTEHQHLRLTDGWQWH
jgi:hypothetical protein